MGSEPTVVTCLPVNFRAFNPAENPAHSQRSRWGQVHLCPVDAQKMPFFSFFPCILKQDVCVNGEKVMGSRHHYICCYCLFSHVRTFATPWTIAPPGSSVHGISQARILEWVVISFYRGSSWPRDWTRVSCTGRWIFHLWATREAYHYLQ